MINTIAIGTLVTLDLRTRILTRTESEETVTLPQSACLCLAALAEANGEVLSQEQLMDIGWRSAGVEVTENSVRVMITKLRRAFVQLEVHNAISLVAVTRSGYRLLVQEASSDLPQPDEPEQTAAPATTPEAHAPAPRPRAGLAVRLCTLLGGIAVGVSVALILRSLIDFHPQPLHFVRWNGPGIPPGSEVMVQKDKQEQQGLITATLQTYTRHVLDRRPNEKPAAVLYVTTGSEKMSKFQGLIACHQPFKDSGNDCESFYFRHY